jgi:PPOX class probable F420-dependent enzyme
VPALSDSVPHSHRDLLQTPLTATLSTVDRSSRPQSTAVWFRLGDDGRIEVSVTSDRQKYKNLVANPNCTLFLIDPANPFRTLEIRATAELTHDPDKVTVRLLAEAYGVDADQIIHPEEDRYTVRLDARHVVANPRT